MAPSGGEAVKRFPSPPSPELRYTAQTKTPSRKFSTTARQDASQLIGTATGSIWDFRGRAISGPLAGRQLRKIMVLKDYWFDWKIYHPDTAVY